MHINLTTPAYAQRIQNTQTSRSPQQTTPTVIQDKLELSQSALLGATSRRKISALDFAGNHRHHFYSSRPIKQEYDAGEGSSSGKRQRSESEETPIKQEPGIKREKIEPKDEEQYEWPKQEEQPPYMAQPIYQAPAPIQLSRNQYNFYQTLLPTCQNLPGEQVQRLPREIKQLPSQFFDTSKLTMQQKAIAFKTFFIDSRSVSSVVSEIYNLPNPQNPDKRGINPSNFQKNWGFNAQNRDLMRLVAPWAFG